MRERLEHPVVFEQSQEALSIGDKINHQVSLLARAIAEPRSVFTHRVFKVPSQLLQFIGRHNTTNDRKTPLLDLEELLPKSPLTRSTQESLSPPIDLSRSLAGQQILACFLMLSFFQSD